jgi:hypothetical protein
MLEPYLLRMCSRNGQDPCGMSVMSNSPQSTCTQEACAKPWSCCCERWRPTTIRRRTCEEPEPNGPAPVLRYQLFTSLVLRGVRFA